MWHLHQQIILSLTTHSTSIPLALNGHPPIRFLVFQGPPKLAIETALYTPALMVLEAFLATPLAAFLILLELAVRTALSTSTPQALTSHPTVRFLVPQAPVKLEIKTAITVDQRLGLWQLILQKMMD